MIALKMRDAFGRCSALLHGEAREMNALLPADEVQAEITLGGFDHAEAESRETRLTAACHIASPPMSPVETAANT